MYSLSELPYAYNALEPFIDEATMRIHHDKHHAAYVDNFNKAVAQYPDLHSKSPEEIITDLSQVPEEIRRQVANQGGGVVNHNFFWSVMGPKASAGGPSAGLSQALTQKFHSIEEFTGLFTETAAKLFGSGWTWLVNTPSGLSIITTSNQDSPLSDRLTPLLALDVWEHAYYLKYQNRRAEYISAWWNVVNWGHVSELYTENPERT